MVSPQLSAAAVRGILTAVAVAALNAGIAACAHLMTGDSTKTVIVTAISTFCTILLARLTEGQFDAIRAAKVARGDLSGLHDADVGADLARRLAVPPVTVRVEPDDTTR